MPKPSKQKKQFTANMDRIALEAHMRCDIYDMDDGQFAKLTAFMYGLKSVRDLGDEQFELTANKPLSEIF